MWGFQAAGAAPLVNGAVVARPKTVANAIQIGNPASWDGALSAREESGGLLSAVTDEQILSAYRLLARREGVFAEPASTPASGSSSRSAETASRTRRPRCWVAMNPSRPRPEPPRSRRP